MRYTAILSFLVIMTACKSTIPWHTCFQTPQPWQPEIDVQADTVLVYGVNRSMPNRIKSWANHGYRTELMTGVAWGNYLDYVEGRFDGREHHDEAQVRRDGTKIMHGKTVPYFVPSDSYREYLMSLLAQAIDAGAEGLFLEEPEFWAFAGYSEAFKREWKQHYGTEWVAPHTSVDARYKAARLMHRLYRDTLAELFRFSKEYARAVGREVRCYVPTHSLINYAQWRIVSPMASLMSIEEADGYIAQVWTGTARTPNYYQGVERQRTFETAYFEYAQMVGMVRPTGRTCFLLADPVEDNPDFGWDDYEANYKRVLVASLLQPDASHYEIMPWPRRVLTRKYFATNEDAARRNDPNPPARVPIPPRYATVLLACVNALNEMDAGRTSIAWNSGAGRIGVLVSDSMMFQRDDPFPSDERLGSFFGLAMPLLKHGMPVRVVQLETLTSTAALRDVDVLLMTYEGMKPPAPAYHDVLARWVRRKGGGLILADDGEDPYHKVSQWWNEDPSSFAHPGQHLTERLGLGRRPAPGLRACGKGKFFYALAGPAALSRREEGGRMVRNWVRQVLEAMGKGEQWREQSHLILYRGKFVVAANMDESIDERGVIVPGRLVSLFSEDLPVLYNPRLAPGQVGLYVDLEHCAAPHVVASASRVRDVESDAHALRFTSRGPAGTRCSTRVRLPARPTLVAVTREGVLLRCEVKWDAASATALLRYDNAAAPLSVRCQW